MKKFLAIFCTLFAIFPAHAGLMVNVEYIHQLIARDWGVQIEYNPELSTPKVAANMEYLLTTVDVANEILNGEKTTDYGIGEYATRAAADDIATNEAARRLIKIEPKFWVTTTADTSEFQFNMSAKGTFQVFWGDGTNDIIVRTDTESATYRHTYATPGEYKIGLGGHAKEYSTKSYQSFGDAVAAISFYNNNNVAGISGSVGTVFPSIGNMATLSTQPRFLWTFRNCINLASTIPENLFSGVSGAPVEYMFFGTFWGCENLQGSIPGGLFKAIQGVPQRVVFQDTFRSCKNLTGTIPADLFAGIRGPAQEWLFAGTFYDCSGLSGSIPANLFEHITGNSPYLFRDTFDLCTGLTGCIPDGLFAGVAATLDEIIADHNPFADSGITQATCSTLEPKFWVTTTDTTSDFLFLMSALGIFAVDWGDGETQYITRTNTSYTTYTHEYAEPGEYTIGIGGYATGYTTLNPAISFAHNNHVAGFTGTLGGIFSTIGDGSEERQQPRFSQLFFNNANLRSTIPENLFAGIHGAPVKNMFSSLFFSCGITGEIPENLFAGIQGAPAENMFEKTFYQCNRLTGEIPENLFAGIQGAPAENMFKETFYRCYGLTGCIPPQTFAGIETDDLIEYLQEQETFSSAGVTYEICPVKQ